MGYTTEFTGKFDIVNSSGDIVEVDNETESILNRLSDSEFAKDTRFSIGHVYFDLPKDFLSNYCQWRLTNNKQHIEWDGGEKFYEYEGWLNIILEKILVPKGYYLSGKVHFQGQESRDSGYLIAEPNKNAIKKVSFNIRKYIEDISTDTLEMQKLLSWLDDNYPEIIDEYRDMNR